MFKKIMVLTLAAMLLVALPLFAGDTKEVKVEKATATEGGQHQTFSGQLVCLGCSLAKADGARAECGAFGHTHALKTEDGRFINFLENKYAVDLLKGEKYHNQQVEVHGVYFANANQLDVETFKVGDKQKGWCDHCKSMDGCGAKAGGM